jgi:hypothetical protein
LPASDSLSTLDGSASVVSDRRGDIEARAHRPHGLFYRNTRFLSSWRLRLDDQPLEALSTDDVARFVAQFLLVQPTGPIYQGSVELELEFAPRPEYGSVYPFLAPIDGGLIARRGVVGLVNAVWAIAQAGQSTTPRMAAAAAGAHRTEDLS